MLIRHTYSPISRLYAIRVAPSIGRGTGIMGRMNETIKIERMGYGAAAVGHLANGKAVFVEGAAPDEVCEVRVTTEKPSFAEAELVEIIEKSEKRMENDCPRFGACGGCQMRHMKYAAQLECKKEIVENAIRRIGGFADFSLDEVIGAENTYNYRNKAVFRAGYENGRVICGFSAAKSHTVVSADDCLICNEAFPEIATAVAEHANKYNIPPFDGKRGILKSVFTRSSRKTGEIVAVISVNAKKLTREDELVKIILSASDKVSGIALETSGNLSVLYGNETLTEEICGIEFTVSPQSFLQVNSAQTERLYEKALEFAGIKSTDVVMDIYCGIGTISLAAAKRATRVIGVEKVKRAIEDAKKNAERNKITNAEFFAAGAEEIVPELIKRGERPDIVILDPPRAGSDEKTLAAICEAAPDKIVYVSCDAASLARDLKFICANGYKITRSAACDMFPHTAHIETVVKLERKI